MTPAERRQAWKDLLDNLDERTFDRGRWSVFIEDAGIINVNGEPAVKIDFQLSRDGVLVLTDRWVTFAPPTHIQTGTDENGEPIYTRNVRAAFRQHFIEVMQGVVERRRAAQ